MSKKGFSLVIVVLCGVLASLAVLPASGAPATAALNNAFLTRVSQSVAVRYWIAHPDQAPSRLRRSLQRLSRGVASPQAAAGVPTFHKPGEMGTLSNQDEVGFPQNEESVAPCTSRGIVLGGTNDYRGLLDPEGNFTGWHLSTDGGDSVTNEGLLPPVEIAGNPVPSGGDPVVKADADCNLFAGSLNYDPVDPDNNPNGVGIYRSDPETLAACPGGSDPECWPTRRAVAESEPGHFLDKEWFDVGESGEAGDVVWTTYTDFVLDPNAPLGFTSASIKAVRCDAELTECTEPILISNGDEDVQFSDVTVGPDGRVYITWAQILGELEQEAQTFVIKLRIAPAGSTEFGPEQVVYEESLAIPFEGFLHANDFRIATYPKHEVVMHRGKPVIWVVWDACQYRLFDSVCEEAQIKLRSSTDDGASWSDTKILSTEGDNYFPAIDGDGETLAVVWFTNRFDEQFHNRQDVEAVTLSPGNGTVENRRRLTQPSNESEADPLLGGLFIGDYIEVAVQEGTAYVHYNANYRQVQVLGEGFPVPQQDNFLIKVGLPR